PGYGWSCPIVWGDKVFVTTAVSDKQKKPSGGFGGGFGGGGGGGFGPGGGFGGRPPGGGYKGEGYCVNAHGGKGDWEETDPGQKPTIGVNPSNGYATETPVTDGDRVYAYFGMTGVYCYDFEGQQVWKADLGSYRIMHGTASSPVLEGDRLIIQCDN